MPRHEIAGPAGRIDALLDEPATRGTFDSGPAAAGAPAPVHAAVVFGHPHTEYGGTMHTKLGRRATRPGGPELPTTGSPAGPNQAGALP